MFIDREMLAFEGNIKWQFMCLLPFFAILKLTISISRFYFNDLIMYKAWVGISDGNLFIFLYCQI